jgi:hypothetical protein
MRERRVTEILAQRLQEERFMSLAVRYGQEQGPDLEARLPASGRRVYIEAKGEQPGGNESAKRRTALGKALLQILLRYDSISVCAIALPNTRGFHPPLARLGIHVLLVGEDGQIWHLGPKTPAGLPRRIASLKDTLENG